ncbi:MAG: hypothetical protein ACREPY_14050, partial [Rhodanobacteraceae bacterium]
SSTLMTCIMLGVLVRAGYEIHRAEDARRMATRRPGLGGSASQPVVPDRPSPELPLAARARIKPTLKKVHA